MPVIDYRTSKDPAALKEKLDKMVKETKDRQPVCQLVITDVSH